MKRRDAIKRTGYFIGGTALSASILGTFSACQKAETFSWTPSFLTPEQGKAVMQIADLLIPKTDTPSATEALVHEYIDVAVKDLFTKEDQTKFQAAFDAFNNQCSEVNGKDFCTCTPEKQLVFLQELEKEAQNAEGPNFFRTLKGLVYQGYFTSEVGATEVLAYDPVPGNYDGCIPFADVGNTWATYYPILLNHTTQ